MKISKYFLMAAAAMSLFACSNDDDLKVNEGNKTLVTLTLGKAESRSLIETAEGNTQYNNVNSLRFEFFTADGRNLNVPQPTDVSAAITALNGSEHKATIGIDNVPLTAYQLVVVANEHTDCPINTGTINTALSSNITLESLHDGTTTLDFNQQNSVMTGRVTGIGNPATDNAPVSVNIPIKPVSSRLQINKITAEKVAPTSDGQTVANIKSFNVAGIYINQFHVSGAVDPIKNPSDRSKVAHTSVESNYLYEHYRACKVTETATTTHDFSFMCDEYAKADATTLTDAEFTNSLNYDSKVSSKAVTTGNSVWEVVPENNKVWGYPVLAGNVEETETGYDVAHIVVRLCDVVYDTDPEVGQPDYLAPRVKYLTITGYKQGTESLTKFERNNVYVIQNLTFDVYNLTDVPYEGNKSINANVTVEPWNAVLVTPEIR